MRTWLGMAALGFTLAAPSAWAKETAATVGGGHMQHCPTAVAGAKTEIKDSKDGVEIVVTSADAAKTEDIRKRAKHMVDSAKTDPTSSRPRRASSERSLTCSCRTRTAMPTPRA